MFDKFFKPQSVAVVGASARPGKIGNSILVNIVNYGFTGEIYPINPEAGEILGLKAYPSLSAVPDNIDLVVICVPPVAVPGVIEDCGRKNVNSVLIITAGFKEIGHEGAKLERDIVKRMKELGIRSIGPNCVGLVSTEAKLNVTFASSQAQARQGNIGFFSQSGALCVAILDWAMLQGIGFSKFISLGNKADINETDMLVALGEDPQTQVILGYIESVDDGARFMQAAERISQHKPIILAKSGGTAAGAKAASSHTGALAGSEQAFKAAFKQTGIIRANSIEQLFDYAMAFSYMPVPEGNSIAILTNSGGPGIIAADAVEHSMLKMASLLKDTIDGLRPKLPSTAALYNPVDIIGDGDHERYRIALDALLKDDNVNNILVILTPTATARSAEVAKVLVSSTAQTKKPIAATFIGGYSIADGAKILVDAKIPFYPFPERAVDAMDRLVFYKSHKDRVASRTEPYPVEPKTVDKLFAEALEKHHNELGETEARAVIQAYGFRVPKSILATSVEHAAKVANEIGYPVVMKIASPDILHKSDIGGVKVGVGSPEEVRETYHQLVVNAVRRMPNAEILGVLVQEMVKGGKEVILGMKRDPQFGPMVMFGLGGIYVEVLKDVSFRIAPFTVEDAREMVNEIRSAALLRGFRGEKPVDMDAIVECLMRLSQLVVDFRNIIELDINPLIVFPKGVQPIALDARLAIERPEEAVGTKIWKRGGRF
ncbi:MAG: acetate--CoA ligase family protein [Planctomycetes bacterium]|nr:acetate--CoA ligase family protein [Planctomycetota bacterium]